MKNYLIKIDDALIENSATRLPVCLCLDLSSSMLTIIANEDEFVPAESGYNESGSVVFGHGGKTKLDFLYDGFTQYVNDIYNDPVSRMSVETCIVGFSDNATCIKDFCGADDLINAVSRESIDNNVGNSTNMGEGLALALDKLEDRKAMYKNAGVLYNQPILFVLSDGQANGSQSVFNNASSRIQEAVKSRKLTFLPIAICRKGEADSSSNDLNRICPPIKAKKLDGTKFTEFFQWLSKSVSVISRSHEGDKFNLSEGADAWGLYET